MQTFNIKTTHNLFNIKTTHNLLKINGTLNRYYSSNIILKKKFTDENFNQYLAGIIDGNGLLLLSKKGYGSLEITMDSRDERCLAYLKTKLSSGTIKAKAGYKSVRYRIVQQTVMFDLINRINGLIRYPQKIKQLKILCEHFGISYIPYSNIDINSAYFSGLFDVNGTITCFIQNNKHNSISKPQLYLSVFSKNKEDLNIWVKLFNGNIYIDHTNKYLSYKWTIKNKQDIIYFLQYTKNNPLRTLKQSRILLIPQYYRLYELHAFKLGNEVLYKKFKLWFKNFSSYGYSRDANIKLEASEVK